MHREEVDRNELREVVVQKCSARLRWRFPMTDHIFRDRRFGNLDTQFHQLAANARCSPDNVLEAHGSNQLTGLFRQCRPSWLAAANLPGPIPPESLPVPTDYGFRFDDDQSRTPPGPQAKQPNPEPSIGTIQHEPL